jgi:hypothetical protein
MNRQLVICIFVCLGVSIDGTARIEVVKPHDPSLGIRASASMLASTPKVDPVSSRVPVSVGTEMPMFKSELPTVPLPLEDEIPRRRLFIDGTDYAESRERFGKPVSSLHAEDDDISLHDVRQGLHAGVDILMSAVESVPTHPAMVQAGLWAQETKAGFSGYFEKLSSVFSSESNRVGKKLYAAADSYSHRFFELVHVRESEHPVLAAKVTRVIVASVLSLTLVFVIFALALHLQRTLVARAHEQAAKQTLTRDEDVEQLFFAMPYPRQE